MRLFVYFVLLFSLSEAKIFTRCRLATEIVKTKMVEKTFLGNWVCLVEKVSNRNTKTLVVSPSGKKSYGLYQIPARWCKEGKKGGDCHIACESLLDDDIRDDTACAVNIFEKEGFKYWEAWNKRCKNDYHITTEIYKCPDLMTNRSPDRTLDVNSRSEKLRYKRKISRVGMIRSRLHSYHAVKWAREY